MVLLRDDILANGGLLIRRSCSEDDPTKRFWSFVVESSGDVLSLRLTEVDDGVLYLASLPSGATEGSFRDTLDDARDRSPVQALPPEPDLPARSTPPADPTIGVNSLAPGGQEWGVDRDPLTVDAALLARLYDDHVDAVHAYLARRLGGELARDLVADVFEAAAGQLARFDPELGSERAWLFGIATNLLRWHWRTEERRLRAWRRAGGRQSVPGDPLLDVVTRLDAESDAATVMAAIADLPADDRDLLLLVVWEGCRYDECAAIVGIPVGTVRSRLHRIRRQLAEAVGRPTDRNQEVTP